MENLICCICFEKVLNFYYDLETFDISNSRIRLLPLGIVKLANLRNLLMNHWTKLSEGLKASNINLYYKPKVGWSHLTRIMDPIQLYNSAYHTGYR